MQRLIVVGASSGGVDALRALASGLPAGLPCAVLAVLHVGPHPSVLPGLLSRSGPLPAHHATHGERIEPARIYVAPPDHHMLVRGEAIELSRGPKAHHSRPAIDPLFVSAALEYGPRTLGVVLTGHLDDGTAGLQAIKRCGGVALVQDPRQAHAPSMPRSALAHVPVDHCVGLDRLPALLAELAAQAPAPAPPCPPELRHEMALIRHQGDPVEHLQALGSPSPFACPDCHGGLWVLHGERPQRFRCHTGHAYTLRTLQHALALAGDEAVWNALRALQERQIVLERMQRSALDGADDLDAGRLGEAAQQLRRQVNALRGLVERMPQALE